MRSVSIVCVMGLLAAARMAAAAPATYAVASGPSQSVRFEARTQMEHYSGKTHEVSGEIHVDIAHPDASPSARFEVKMSSLTTGNGTRDSNMRRFLQTDRHPTAVFMLKRLDAPGAPLVAGKPVSGVAHGTLTLHGVTREIEPPVTVTLEHDADGRPGLHVTSRFVVRLQDYKISTPRFLFFSVRQEHAIFIDVHALAKT